jgi:hypothetical protein
VGTRRYPDTSNGVSYETKASQAGLAHASPSPLEDRAIDDRLFTAPFNLVTTPRISRAGGECLDAGMSSHTVRSFQLALASSGSKQLLYRLARADLTLVSLVLLPEGACSAEPPTHD